ncbi:MAG: tetratricopeptide repeat protein, partial [Muribaculaceae bacterium]|nr:tetratricopeptide repeat protein [Muribaculaceae bacterium]
VICAAVGFSASADLIDRAREEVTRGDWWQAEKTLRQAVQENPKLTSTAQYNYLLGAVEFETGNYPEARELLLAAKAKGNGAANLYLGRLAFLDYDFDKATALYSEFKRHREKSGQVVGETVEGLERQLSIAENALESVEKITVIDSIAVPAEDFFSYYKLSPSSGRFIAGDDLPLEKHRNGVEMAFVNEGGDFMMWGEPDEVGNVRVVESTRLTDGTWQEPEAVPSFLYQGGYSDYPFMMADGVTLYYAATGEQSMGGYDIFVVSRDPQTGEYLQPRNVGMPFNSPHDDFLLAVDEETGVGWWATDRNLLGDKVTLYVYIVNDLRKNYDEEEEEDIISKARLTDFRSTQNVEEKEKYAALLKEISELDSNEDESSEGSFRFPMPGGTVYHELSDFRSVEARVKMERYLAGEEKLQGLLDSLKTFRQRYPVNRADNVKEEILRLENETEKLRKEQMQLRSEIYRQEKEKR